MFVKIGRFSPVTEICGSFCQTSVRFPFVVFWLVVEVSTESIHFVHQLMNHPKLHVTQLVPDYPETVSKYLKLNSKCYY